MELQEYRNVLRYPPKKIVLNLWICKWIRCSEIK